MARKAFVEDLINEWGDTLKISLYNTKIKTIHDLFTEWCVSNNKKIISYPSFSNYFQKFRAQHQDLFVEDIRIVKEDPNHMTYREKLYQIRVNVDLLSNGYSNGFILSGSPGISKTSEVIRRLKECNLKYTYFKGAIQNSLELYKYLYHHRDEEIIVIDDTQGLIEKDASAAHIISAALDDNHLQDNIVSYLHKDLKSQDEIEKMGPGRAEKIIPNNFKITSGIIFITNTPMRKIKEAVNSRCFPIDFWLTKEEIICLIEDELESILPDAPMEIKRETVSFFRNHKEQFKRFDIRTYKKVTLLRLAQKEMPKDGLWEKMAINTVRSTYI